MLAAWHRGRAFTVSLSDNGGLVSRLFDVQLGVASAVFDPTTSMRGPQSGVTQPVGSTLVNPGDSVSTAVTAAGAGGTVFFKAGKHRLAAKVNPPANQTWLGEYGAVISGGVVVTGPWTVSTNGVGGTVWYATGSLPAGYTPSVTQSTTGGNANANLQHDLFRDGAWITRVGSLAAVVPGTYWADYTNNRFYVGDDPTGHTFEQANTATAIDGSNTGLTLDNLYLELFASNNGGSVNGNAAAVMSNGTSNTWTVRNCEFRNTHYTGLVVYGNDNTQAVTVRKCVFRNNGNTGVQGNKAHGGTIDDCEFLGNNMAGFDQDWESGGYKFTKSDSWSVTKSWFHANYAAGLWNDIECRYWTIGGAPGAGNVIESNTRHGIHYEICWDATISYNTIRNNTGGSGLALNVSQNVTVAHNTFSGNGKTSGGPYDVSEISLQDGDRSTDPTGNSRSFPSLAGAGVRAGVNNTVTDNTVTHIATSGYAAGMNRYDSTHGTLAYTSNTWDRNAYHLSSTSAARFLWSAGAVGFTAWQAIPQDTAGSVS